MLYTLDEHQNKKLVANEFQESTKVVGKIKPDGIKTLEESAKGKGKRKLIVKMEAIHVGKTKNSTFYTEEGLKGGLESWTHPYNKPVLTHHNSYNGEAIGRILNAEYAEQTMSGKSGLVFTVEITDSDAMEKVLDGRYQTVSIGASTDKVTCNICGTDRTQEWCEHYPGQKYDEQSCHFIIGNTFGREVSYVNTPSDENAGNRSVQVVDEEDGNTNEHANMQIFQMAEGLYQDADNPEVNLYEHLSEDVKKMIDQMTSVKEGSEQTMPPEENQTTEGNQTPAPVGATQESTPAAAAEGTPVTENNQSETEEATNISTLTEKIGQMQESISKLVFEKQKVETLLQTAESENDRLVKENAALIESSHIALAEKVVDMKLSLNKADVIGVDRSEAINKHVKRTKESLEDAIADLVSESKTNNMPAANSVTNPGISGDEGQDSTNKMSLEEGVGLMMGMFNRSKK